MHFIDHINRDLRDNRFENLREATNGQNMQNSGVRRDQRSGAKGISLEKRCASWRVRVQANGKRYCVFCRGTLADAIAIRAGLAKELHGDFVREA